MVVLFYVGIAHILLFIIGGILNIYALYCLLKFKKTNNDLQFGNLEKLLLALNASDLLACLVSGPMKIIVYMILISSIQQRFTFIVDFFCQFSSTSIITMIAINNCIKITRFSTYDSLVTDTRINNFIRATFIVSALTLLVPILISPAFSLALMVLTVLTSLIVMVISYVTIVKELKRSDEKIRNEATAEGKRRVKRENKVSKTILILMTCFFMCTILPTIVAGISYFLFGLKVFKTNMPFIVIVFNSNTISNPCIYVLKNSKYRLKLFRKRKTEDNNQETKSNPRRNQDLNKKSSSIFIVKAN